VAARAAASGRLLVLDECRATGGGIADPLIAALAEGEVGARLTSVRAADSYVPLGPAADLVLVTVDEVVQAAIRLAAR
jgi:2-oxoisovalerate dehydrogenase E1 component